MTFETGDGGPQVLGEGKFISINMENGGGVKDNDIPEEVMLETMPQKRSSREIPPDMGRAKGT